MSAWTDKSRDVSKSGRKASLCATATALDQLDPASRADAEADLAPDSGWSHTSLAAMFTGLGARLSPGQIGYHRRGTCACPK